jgi:hypothetical protein
MKCNTLKKYKPKGNPMKIKIKDLYKHIGNTVFITNSEVIDDGTYVLTDVNKEQTLFNIKNGTIETVKLDKQANITPIYTPPTEKIELMKEAVTAQILMLSSKGWTIDEGGDKDISPYVARLHLITTLMEDPNISGF